MNDDFENVAFQPNLIAQEAFLKGLQEGKQKVDTNIYQESYIEGWNQGAMKGLLESHIDILKLIYPQKEFNQFEQQLQQCKAPDDFIKLRRELIKINALKGVIQLKKQSLDF